MGIASALGFIGAAATGYQSGLDDKRRKKIEDDGLAYQAVQRDRAERRAKMEDDRLAREEAQRVADLQAGQPAVDTGVVQPSSSAVTTGAALAAPQDDHEATNPAGAPVVDQPVEASFAAPKPAPSQTKPLTASQRMRRVAAVQHDPMRQAQMEAQATQAEIAETQLAQTKWRSDVGLAMKSGPTGIAALLTSTKADGKGGQIQYKYEPAPDGKSGKIVGYGPDGKPEPEEVIQFRLDDGGQEFATAAYTLAHKTDPDAMLTHYRDVARDKNARTDADRRYALDETRTKAQAAREERMARAAERAAAASEAKSQGENRPAVWDDKADAFLRQRYTAADPTTGEVVVDGGGLQFAKRVALAQAMRNGGDTTTAMGYAFEIDARIKQQAGGDPAKVAAIRGQLLQSLTAEPAPPAAAPAAPAKPAAQPAPAAKPAAPSMAAAAAPGATDKILAGIQGGAQAEVARLHQAVVAAQAQLAAVAKSGDPVALAKYAQIVQQAIAARDKEATKRLGNGAAKFIATLPA